LNEPVGFAAAMRSGDQCVGNRSWATEWLDNYRRTLEASFNA
jgi:hypothetical protein